MTGRAPCSVLVIAGFSPSLVNFRGPLLAAMREAGHNVAAAAPGLTADPAAVELTALGIRCRDLPLSRTGRNPFADAGSLVAMVRLIRSEHPDVVFAYTMKPVIFGLIAAAMVGSRRRYALITGLGYAFTGAGRGRRALVQRISRTLYRIALKRADKVFFQNGDDAALFGQLGLVPRRVPVVIVNGSGVDVARFFPAPLPPAPVRFLLIARLLATKGIREFAAAARIVRAAHPDAEFHLVGGTDANPDAIPLAEVQGWHDAGVLIWHGEVDDVRPHIAAAHVYVLPSYREGTPRSVLESMAMARPIITTDAPGCRETVIDGDNGWLVPPHTVEPLAAAMARFIGAPDLIERMGRRSRAIAETRYDVVDVNARMLNEMELA
jgi:glycosyltransferase involved in cell wall biosynthesis